MTGGIAEGFMKLELHDMTHKIPTMIIQNL